MRPALRTAAVPWPNPHCGAKKTGVAKPFAGVSPGLQWRGFPTRISALHRGSWQRWLYSTRSASSLS
ncbi:MAG: hypothetical protein ACREVW_11685, partial [Burkholderiales bacterium]